MLCFTYLIVLRESSSSYLALVAEVNCLNLTTLLLVLVLTAITPAPLLITVAAGMPAVIVTIPAVPTTTIALLIPAAPAALIFPIALCVLKRRALLILC